MSVGQPQSSVQELQMQLTTNAATSMKAAGPKSMSMARLGEPRL